MHLRVCEDSIDPGLDLWRKGRAASLRPDLVREILAGDEPDGLSLKQLLLGVPVRWEEQKDP